MSAMAPITDCRYFNGYKPCGRNAVCDSQCASQDRPQISILIIHLGAMGAVVRSTSLLAPIKRKYPSSKITWITEAPMQNLLQGHPLIDQVLTISHPNLFALQGREFDIGFVIDKSAVAAGIASGLRIDQVFGFRMEPRFGGIVVANPEAQELWELGLSDQKKFFKNKKPETQLITEALGLSWRRDDYDLRTSAPEKIQIQKRHSIWSVAPDQPVIGFNTGCGALMPAKKWTVERHRQILKELIAAGLKNLVLLGGPEDQVRNQEIGRDLPVIQSETIAGLREGSLSVAACDILVTGDSLGMHLGIAHKKHVIAWFGPSCAVEIDLYDRGEKLLTTAPCSPCWKKDCQEKDMCYDQLSLAQILSSIFRGVQSCQSPSYSSKPLSWEMSF